MEQHSMLTATKHSPTRRLTILNNCSCLVMWGVFHLTKSAENLKTKTNGTEISRESSQKIRKMLNLRNESHSAEDSRKFGGAKLNRNKPSAITCFDIPCSSRAPTTRWIFLKAAALVNCQSVASCPLEILILFHLDHKTQLACRITK